VRLTGVSTEDDRGNEVEATDVAAATGLGWL
jgi:hypothetical protein